MIFGDLRKEHVGRRTHYILNQRVGELAKRVIPVLLRIHWLTSWSQRHLPDATPRRKNGDATLQDNFSYAELCYSCNGSDRQIDLVALVSQSEWVEVPECQVA